MDFVNHLEEICSQPLIQLPRTAVNECHLIVANDHDLRLIAQWAKEMQLYLCTLVASDERMLESHQYKLYYVFSAPDGDFLILEYPLPGTRPLAYISIRDLYPSVEPLERKAFDLYGVIPIGYADGLGRFVLHDAYPGNLHPLRRTRNYENLKRRQSKRNVAATGPRLVYPAGMMVLPVGPIHAGIIEAGQFPFVVAGEVIEDVPVRLGYKHRGIEKLLESHYSLLTGWELVEKVSGDSSFSHSMAFCLAVESLANVIIPESAQLWRALLLELERIYNHIADVGALAHDISLDVVAADLAVLRETAVQLNHRLCGHRLLRGINRPGGIVFPHTPDLTPVPAFLTNLQKEFLALSHLLLELPSCRDRMITTGVLTAQEAQQGGATGLAMRATGAITHDFRLRHPIGVYKRPLIQTIIRELVPQDRESSANLAGVYKSDLKGDVFARMALRIAEVNSSIRICIQVIDALTKSVAQQETWYAIDAQVSAAPSFEFGLGYVENWRGDLFYWVMKGPNNAIFRCKVRDPSVFNWSALRTATRRKPRQDQPGKYWENILADFPLINKSFNLSYAANDL